MKIGPRKVVSLSVTHILDVLACWSRIALSAVALLLLAFLVVLGEDCRKLVRDRRRGHALRLTIELAERRVRIGRCALAKRVQAHFVLLGEVVRMRFQDGGCHLGLFSQVTLVHALPLLALDLALNVLLLPNQIRLRHDLLVKGHRLLLEARLQEALAHRLDHVVHLLVRDTVELDPLSQEARSDLNAATQVKSVVLCAAEH